jgi:hypothetical protein
VKGRQLVGGTSLGPETLEVAYQAFDMAWAEISERFGDNPEAIESARLELGKAVFAVTKEGSTDPIQLKNAALRMMGVLPPDADRGSGAAR